VRTEADVTLAQPKRSAVRCGATTSWAC